MPGVTPWITSAELGGRFSTPVIGGFADPVGAITSAELGTITSADP
jgi:hypothetical protein